jgi:protein tyrosine phosphatase (PTP) superfamily phosphohydrolase (DUF442 family)
LGWRGFLIAGLTLFSAGLLHVTLGSNFHTVLSGRVYRCAQPSSGELEQLVRRYGIRTVINLRGFSAPWPWFVEESEATHRLNVSQEDLSFSANRLPSAPEVRRLVEVLDESEYPLLLHCRRGADRTGLASAMVCLLHTDTDLGTARRQLSPRYGHVPLAKTRLLDRFLDLYADWLNQNGVDHSPANFRRWATYEYCPGECRCDLALLEPLPVIPPGRPFAARLRVRNISVWTWHFRPGTGAGVHAVCSLNDLETGISRFAKAGFFDAQVAPGQSIDLTLVVPALPAGRYRVFIDMVDSQGCLFFQTGSEPLEQELVVCEQETAAGSRPGVTSLARLADRLDAGR